MTNRDDNNDATNSSASDDGPASSSASLPELAGKWSRAIERGKGIRISAEDLYLLTVAGVNDLLQAEAAKILKEQSKWRDSQRKNVSTPEAYIGSIGTSGETIHLERQASRSSGMTSGESVSDLLAQVQARLQKGGKR